MPISFRLSHYGISLTRRGFSRSIAKSDRTLRHNMRWALPCCEAKGVILRTMKVFSYLSQVLVRRKRVFVTALVVLSVAALTIGSYYLGASRSPKPNYPIIGNRRTRIYHWHGCPNYYDIAPENQVIFATPEEAENRRFRAAQNCPSAPPRLTSR